MDLTAMQRRPVWRWKSFWLGVLVVMLLAGSWVTSVSQYLRIQWVAVDWSMSTGSSAGGVWLQYYGYAAGVSDGLRVESGALGFRRGFPKAYIVRWSGGERIYGVRVAYWLLIAVFLPVWGGFLYWRWRRMRRTLTSMAA